MEENQTFWNRWPGIIIKIVMFIAAVYFFQWLGFWGFMLFFLGMPIYRAITQRQYIKSITKTIESSIFGKPLDKTLWKKGELKQKKVKIVWGDKHGREKRNDKGGSEADKHNAMEESL